MIESKIYKPPTAKCNSKPLSNIFKIFFDNKTILFINLLSIRHGPAVHVSISHNKNK